MKRYQRILTLLPAVMVLPLFAWGILQQASWLPPCHFYNFTGLHCTGCGMTRATRALLHGDLLSALRMNLLGTLLLPVLGVGLAAETLAWVLQRPSLTFKLPGKWPAYLASLIVAFTILRNLPGFDFLAPY